MKRIAWIAALLAGVLLGTQAHAQPRGTVTTPPGTGGYFGVGVMQTYTDNATDFAFSAIGFGGSADSNATGFKVYGGYIWPQRFGIEVGYYDLGTYDVFTFGLKSDEFSTTALTISGVFSLPLNPKIGLLFKLGLAFTDVDYRCFSSCGWPYINTSHSDMAGLMSIGLDWRLAQNFSLRTEWEYFGGVVHMVGGLRGDYGYSVISLAGQFNF